MSCKIVHFMINSNSKPLPMSGKDSDYASDIYQQKALCYLHSLNLYQIISKWKLLFNLFYCKIFYLSYLCMKIKLGKQYCCVFFLVDSAVKTFFYIHCILTTNLHIRFYCVHFEVKISYKIICEQVFNITVIGISF